MAKKHHMQGVFDEILDNNPYLKNILSLQLELMPPSGYIPGNMKVYFKAADEDLMYRKIGYRGLKESTYFYGHQRRLPRNIVCWCEYLFAVDSSDGIVRILKRSSNDSLKHSGNVFARSIFDPCNGEPVWDKTARLVWLSVIARYDNMAMAFKEADQLGKPQNFSLHFTVYSSPPEGFESLYHKSLSEESRYLSSCALLPDGSGCRDVFIEAYGEEIDSMRKKFQKTVFHVGKERFLPLLRLLGKNGEEGITDPDGTRITYDETEGYVVLKNRTCSIVFEYSNRYRDLCVVSFDGKIMEISKLVESARLLWLKEKRTLGADAVRNAIYSK